MCLDVTNTCLILPKMAPKSADSKPLPISDTLQDLAVLRAANIDLASVLGASYPDASINTMGSTNANVDPESQTSETPGGQPANSKKDSQVEQSFEYAHEVRAAIRMFRRGDVDNQGTRVDGVRDELEEILDGLTSK